MIQDQLPMLILAIPLLSSFAISICGRAHQAVAFAMLTGAMAASFACAIGVLSQVVSTGQTIHYFVGDWPAPYGIELVIDHLNAMLLCIVSGVGLLVSVYSWRPVPAEVPERLPGKKVPGRVPNFCVLYCLLVTGLLGICATGDAFNMYVLLEIAALSGYALLALGSGRSYYATFKYLVMGTIGACLYLLGVGYVYIKTGSLNMADLKGLLTAPALMNSATIHIAFIMIVVGISIKMALFPMHGWLPNSYTHAPTASSCLIAPLVTKVSVYMMVRVLFSVFSAAFVFTVIPWHGAMVWVATAAIVFGSVSALGQSDLKKMLTYIIVAEVGYMAGGVWLGNASGLTGATYHILGDAMMTVCLFMVVGAIIHKTGDSSRESMRGIFKKMPVTSVVFLVGAFAMIGIPPTCGFFTKRYLIVGAFQAGQWAFAGALLFSSLINAVIFFRLIEIGYFPKFSGEEESHGHGTHGRQVTAVDEAPLSMLVPMLIAAASLIVIGLYTNEIITGLIGRTIPAGLL